MGGKYLKTQEHQQNKHMVRLVNIEKPDKNTGLFVSHIADHAKNLVRCFSILS